MASSTVDPSIPPLKPHFQPQTSSTAETPELQTLINTLQLQSHIEGGYFVETDRDVWRIPNPFLASNGSSGTPSKGHTSSTDDSVAEHATTNVDQNTRSASTSIHYLLTPSSNLGAFHRNRGRTIHTLHSGRGRYVIIHADEVASEEYPQGYPSSDNGAASSDERAMWQRGKKARVETFIVGHDVAKGERLQWIVEGGKYKASYILPDSEGGVESKGLLISETVVPGFEYADHDFLRAGRFESLVTEAQANEMRWMLRTV